jgi:hypothetical protein
VILNQAAYDAAYPSGSEPTPRVEYFVLAMTDGALVDATFGWSKNEVISRFTYDGRNQRFKLLAGGPLSEVGRLDSSNPSTQQLKVIPPTSAALAAAPYRLSVGTGSGQTFNVNVVGAFGAPPVGTVEVNSSTGALNWNAADIATYNGQAVRWQRQQFFTDDESSGRLGLVTEPLLLNPLPATGQHPMLRLGYGLWLQTIEVPTDASLAPLPAAGAVKWSRLTGRLAFSAADTATGEPVYYDGVLFARDQQLPRQSLNTVASPSTISVLPPIGGDLIFRVPGHQFASYVRLDPSAPFSSPGTIDVVEVRPSGSTGSVHFSSFDQALYASYPVEVIFGDLPLERGIGFRLFRSLVNPSADPALKDVSVFYPVLNATLASPILSAPQVFLPALPIDAGAYPVTVHVEQGTGTWTGPLPRLDGASPPAGVGYVIDFDKQVLQFANRRVNDTQIVPSATGTMALSAPLVLGTNYAFAAEVAPGSGVYRSLVVGQDVILDPTPGLLTFSATSGGIVTTGLSGSFSGTTFKDTSNGTPLQVGDYLIVTSGAARGVYKVATGGALSAGVHTDVAGVTSGNLVYEVRRNPEVVIDRYWQELLLVDPNTVVSRIRKLGTATAPATITSGTGTFDDDTTMSSGVNFVAAGVQAGDTLQMTTGPDAGSFRTITVVDAHLVQVATPFTSYAGASFQIIRRLRLPTMTGMHAVRLGQSFSTPLLPVNTDADFGVLAPGMVQVSLATGNLNFSTSDFGQQVYSVQNLTQGRDYKLQPALGFIEFTERFMAGDEGLVTYIPVDSSGNVGTITQERLTFLVRKEVTQPYPRPAITSTVYFNPLGRTVASNPAPEVFRGGRPQTIPTQCVVNVTTSAVIFEPDTVPMTDALPHGAGLGTDERVYVDYYVYEAIGGEKSVNLLNAMQVSNVSIVGGSPTLTLAGNQTGIIKAGQLLRIEHQEAYSIASSVFLSGTNETLVTLAPGATFSDDFTNPKLYVTSGTVSPAYFRTETQPYQAVARGMSIIRVYGDRTASYQSGTVLRFSIGSQSDVYLVSGSRLKDGWTEITLTANTRQQYTSLTHTIQGSVRPILEDGATSATTSKTPILTEAYGVIRKAEGAVGQLVMTGPPTPKIQGYSLDASGVLTFSPTLSGAEELVVYYTGHQELRAGTTVRSTYTHAIVPDATNGIAGQNLTMDYTVFGPDTFIFRVETLTNFSAEVMAYFRAQAQSSSPGGGPITSNAASPKLYEQGQPSAYFSEGHLHNQDWVAQLYLKYANDSVNHLEDVLQSLDGRIVGADQGRFRYDGKWGNPARTSYSAVTNEIDDSFKVSNYPYTFTWPPLAITWVGTYQQLYQPGPQSRFYPTFRSALFGITTAGRDTDANSGDAISDLRWKNLTDLPPTTHRRLPRAQVTKRAEVGDGTIYVDNANGTQDLYRPAFAVGMAVVIQQQDGTHVVPDTAPLTITGVLSSPERIQVGALPVAVPIGSTVYLCTTGATPDTVYAKNYRTGTDIAVNKDEGKLVYIKPYPPLDGSVPAIPADLRIKPPNSEEFLQLDGVGVQSLARAPYRFPALDGKALNDVGDTGLPMQIRSYTCEQVYLEAEQEILTTLLAATPSNVVTGASLDLLLTTITVPSAWVSPVPRVHDLVRFTTGVNSTAGFRRIVSVGASSITVDHPFPVATISDSILVTASPDVATGTATFPSALILDDPALSAGIEVGHTIILTSGLNVGTRRQVVRRLSTTQLQLDHAVPSPMFGGAYRVSNHVATNSTAEGLSVQGRGQINNTYFNDHILDPSVVDSEISAVLRYLDGDPVDVSNEGVLTDILSPGTQTGTVSGNTLMGSTDFIAAGVSAAHYVYIQTGASRGVYPVATVTSAVQLTVVGSFPISGPVLYRIVSTYNLSRDGFTDLFSIYAAADDWTTATMTWLVAVMASMPVYVSSGLDPNIYANPLLTPMVTNRKLALDARVASVADLASGPIALVQKILQSRERLYDKRYTWIDGRINLDKGLRFMYARAQQNRIDAFQQQLNDLTKMLAMGAS